MQEYLVELNKLFLEYPYLKVLFMSAILVVLFLIVKMVVRSNIDKKKGMPRTERQFLANKASQYINYIMLLCLVFVWFTQLQVFFVSLFAVAAAIVIAFKELIMCFTGGILLRSSKIYKEGQRIEVAGVRGFVIESKLLTTKVLEIGPEKYSQQTTGDIISIPNSLILANSVKNQSYFKGYSIKAFSYHIPESVDYHSLERSLLEKANSIAGPYLDDAKKEIRRFCEKEGIVIPGVEPRTKIIFEEDYEAMLLLKVPVQNSNIADVEQELNRLYLSLVRK